MTQTHTVPEELRHSRADKALAMAFPEHSRVAFQRSFDAGLVRLRGKRRSTRKATVHAGDVLEFSFAEVVASELRAVDIPLDVLFEDKSLLAINKPAGMVVHPGAGTREDTLVHALLAHCKGSLSGIGGVERPGIVHRLDRETSGVIIVAKTDAGPPGAGRAVRGRTVIKEYSGPRRRRAAPHERHDPQGDRPQRAPPPQDGRCRGGPGRPRLLDRLDRSSSAYGDLAALVPARSTRAAPTRSACTWLARPPAPRRLGLRLEGRIPRMKRQPAG
jgi:hypothetical protein